MEALKDEDFGMKDIRCACGGREGKIITAKTLDRKWIREQALCMKCQKVALERFAPVRPLNKLPATAWVKP